MGNITSITSLQGLSPTRARYFKNGSGTAEATIYSDLSTGNATAADPADIASPGSTAGATCDSTTTGAVLLPGVTGGQKIYLARVRAGGGSNGNEFAVLAYDRLWHNSGLVANVATTQSFSPVALPARAGSYTNILAFVQIWTAGGSATVTPSTTVISYTNQSGTAGQTASVVASATSNSMFSSRGKMAVFGLQAGDTGIQSIQSLTLGTATATAGNIGLMLARPIAYIGPTAPAVASTRANVPVTADWLELGLAEVDSAACLGFAQMGQTSALLLPEFVVA